MDPCLSSWITDLATDSGTINHNGNLPLILAILAFLDIDGHCILKMPETPNIISTFNIFIIDADILGSATSSAICVLYRFSIVSLIAIGIASLFVYPEKKLSDIEKMIMSDPIC